MKFEHHHDLCDADYVEASKLHVQYLAKEAASAQEARREYGRWMITSLVIAHSAALAGLVKFGNTDALAAGGYFFTAGLVFGFLSGLCASVFFALHSIRLNYLGDPSQIYNRNAPIRVPKPLRISILTVYIISVTSGFASLAMIAAGVNAVGQSLGI